MEKAALLLRLYQEMARGRALEARVNQLVNDRDFRGFFHPGRGQEAVPAGACTALRPDDYLLYAHRGLTYLTAKGMDPVAILGDFQGRVSGSTRGLGAGIVHCVDLEHGIMGQGGTLGSCFTLSAGLGLASRSLGEDRVTVAFFGDGAAARGTFLEAGVTAVAWKLPLVWICENNGWAVSVRLRDAQGVDAVAPRAAGMGWHTQTVDGQDPVAVHEATMAALEHARAGEGPVFIETMTTRVDGHYAGDLQPYRPKTEIAEARERDPLILARRRLIDLGVEAARMDAIDRQAEDEMAAADAQARRAPMPTAERIFEGLWA